MWKPGESGNLNGRPSALRAKATIRGWVAGILKNSEIRDKYFDALLELKGKDFVREINALIKLGIEPSALNSLSDSALSKLAEAVRKGDEVTMTETIYN